MEVTTSIGNSSQYVPEHLTKHEGSLFTQHVKYLKLMDSLQVLTNGHLYTIYDNLFDNQIQVF